MADPIFIRYARPESIVNGTIGNEGLLITAQQMMARVCRRNGRPAWDINNIVQGMLPDWFSSKVETDRLCFQFFAESPF